jgi:tetratricopeptide (TPR) repeat protein
MVTQGLMDKVIQSDEQSLAVIMGHELAHLTKDHVSKDRKAESAVLLLSFGRDQEIEADLDGMRYAIAAGYPYRKGVAKSFQAMRANTKYSSFEGLNATHPSWEERLVFLDREQAKLWSAMSAFRNGHAFLEMEQYLSAQQCFRAVTAEFPDCHEAWANLGYARLMQYCDGMDYDDLRRFGIGQIVIGGFYLRPESLESKVRGIDEKLWKDAVKALDKALALNSDLVLPRASLGVAHLVHPDGKDVKTARKWFGEALARFDKDPELKKNPVSLAALLVNAGVADMAAGDDAEATRKFRSADKIAATQGFTAVVRGIEEAVAFNQAILSVRGKDRKEKLRAYGLLATYLARTSPESSWWPLAYAHYAKAGKDLGAEVRKPSSFFRKAAPSELRTVTAVTVGKEVITLSDPTQQVVKSLGADDGEAIPLYPDSKIVRWRFVERGIDLLAKEKVIAIFLTSKDAPPVVLRQIGVAGDAKQLKVGMAEELVRFMLKDQNSDHSLRAIDDAKTRFHFYPQLGLAIRYADSRVAEIAIAQMPRRMMGEK